MVTATVPSSLKRRLDMAIDHLLSQGHFDLAVRLTQGDENELCLVTVEDIDAGTSDADNILKDGKYRGFPRSVTDGLRSYVEYGERLFGRGQKAFVEHGANRKTSSTF